jgi:hypothetical protein
VHGAEYSTAQNNFRRDFGNRKTAFDSGNPGEEAGCSIFTQYRRGLPAERYSAVKLPGEADRYEVTKPGDHCHFKYSSCNKVFDIHEGIKYSTFLASANSLSSATTSFFMAVVAIEVQAWRSLPSAAKYPDI